MNTNKNRLGGQKKKVIIVNTPKRKDNNKGPKDQTATSLLVALVMKFLSFA